MNTEWSSPTKYIAGISLALLAIYILHLLGELIPLLILAALLAMIVRPVILWLHVRARLPRSLAVGLVYLGLAILVPLALLLTVRATTNAVGTIVNLGYPDIFSGVIEWLDRVLVSIKGAQLPSAALDAYVDGLVDDLLIELKRAPSTPAVLPPPTATVLHSLGATLTATFDVAAGLVGVVISQAAAFIFVFLASIYISLDAHTFQGAILRLVPNAYRPEIARLLAQIEGMWIAFFRGELTLMLLIGAFTWVGLSALGMPGAFNLAVIAGLLELVPSLGPVLAAIPAVTVALVQGSNYLPVSHLAFAGLVILFYIILQQLENSVMVPRVLGDAVELPPLVVIVGILVGAAVGGVLGALLATPIIASGREILRYILRKMQGDEPFPPDEAPPEPAAQATTGLSQWLRKRVPWPASSHSPVSRQQVTETASSVNNDADCESLNEVKSA